MSFAPPPPPLGLVAAGGPPAVGMPQPPLPPMRMVGVPPSMMKRPLQILLANVPPFLHGARPMRSWVLAGGGGVRSIVMVPPPPVLKPGETLKTIAQHADAVKISALLTMSHADAALKVITAFRHFQQKLKDGGQDDAHLSFAAHSVPTNPDIPLPPAVMDKETVTVLGDKLYEAFQQLKDGKETDKQAGVNSSTVNDNSASKVSIDENSNMRSTSDADPQDGGDEGDDPLTAPAILEAVRKFREQLSLQQGSKAIRRQQLVKEAIEKALPAVRQRLQEERAAAGVMPPGLPPVVGGGTGGPPLPPPPPTLPEGPRGVSNKPAWMTQQQQQHAQDTEEPHAKKIKLDLSDSTMVFSAVKAESVEIFRAFVAEKIRHYLGQEEADLIDFVYKHVLEQKSVAALQSDLADVLEEDAPAFLQAMYEKSHELS